MQCGLKRDWKWIWSEDYEAWLTGAPDCGAGVFWDDGDWFANVVLPAKPILSIGPLESLEMAQLAALHLLEEQLDLGTDGN